MPVNLVNLAKKIFVDADKISEKISQAYEQAAKKFALNFMTTMQC